MFELIGVGIGVFATMVGLWLIFGNRSSSAIRYPDRVWKAQTTVKVIIVEHAYRVVSIPKRLKRLTEKILQLDDDGLQAIAEYQMPRIYKKFEEIQSLPDLGEMAEKLIISTTDELEEIRLSYDNNIQKLLEVGAVLIYSLEEQVAAVEARRKGLVLVGKIGDVFITDIPEDMRGLELTPEAINAYFEKHPIRSK